MFIKVMLVLVAYYLGKTNMNLDDFLEIIKRLLGHEDNNDDGG